jgi:hypothetical protein
MPFFENLIIIDLSPANLERCGESTKGAKGRGQKADMIE